MTSAGGVLLLAAVERRMGMARTRAPLIADPRTPLLATHGVADIPRARMLAIACGYEDADDLDHPRTDPGFNLACARLPDGGAELCAQPTMSRRETAPTPREVIRMSYAMVDISVGRSRGACHDPPPAGRPACRRPSPPMRSTRWISGSAPSSKPCPSPRRASRRCGW